MQGVADVEELLLPVQLELVQRFRPRLPPEAINFLTVHTNDVAQIAVPPENSAEDVVKFVEWHLIGDRDQADDYRAHLAQNRSQNQAFEGGCFNHLSRLLGSRPPTFWCSPAPSAGRFAVPAALLGDREKPGAKRAAKLILVYYVPPKRCHAGSPPWTPKQKQSSIAPGFSWSPFSDAHERLDILALDKQGSLDSYVQNLKHN